MRRRAHPGLRLWDIKPGGPRREKVAVVSAPAGTEVDAAEEQNRANARGGGKTDMGDWRNSPNMQELQARPHNPACIRSPVPMCLSDSSYWSNRSREPTHGATDGQKLAPSSKARPPP